VRVRSPRRLGIWTLVIGALALSVPAVTLAAGGGGSAGDQQYTDPFAGTSPTHTATSAPTTAAAPTAPATPPTTAAPPSSPPATTSVQPTATIAGDPTATIASTSANQLPYTGYDGWLAAAFGFVMVGGGLVLRRRTGRS
jgi:LPXTG-motif cell wall-anchored protein